MQIEWLFELEQFPQLIVLLPVYAAIGKVGLASRLKSSHLLVGRQAISIDSVARCDWPYVGRNACINYSVIGANIID